MVIVGVIAILLALAIVLLGREGGGREIERDADAGGRAEGAARAAAQFAVTTRAESARPVHLFLAGRAV